MSLTREFLLRCERLGVPPTDYVLAVAVRDQNVSLYHRAPRSAADAPLPNGRRRHAPPSGYRFLRQFRCSTSEFGTGQVEGSRCTPLGLHRVAAKIGGGWPAGAVFRSRRVVGFTWRGLPEAKITTRILWLEGLEQGFNRGGQVDSRRRFIYIHGTGNEPGLGRPASSGCVQLAADDLIPLFDRLPMGSLVWITEG